MKKARLFSLFAVILCIMLLVACNNGNDGDDNYYGNNIPNEPTDDYPTACEEHTWDSGFVRNQPTCLRNGEHVYKCTVCKTVKYEEIPATGEHTFDEEWTKNETHHWHYATCACIHLNKKSDYGEHNWSEGVVTTEPTCRNYGTLSYYCIDCGINKTESIPRLEHTYNTDVWEYSPVWSHWHPSTCGCTDERSDVGSHIWDEGVVTTPATCSSPGILTRTCTVCPAQKEENIYDISAHVWNEGVVTQPTCVARGYTTYTCTLCSDTYVDSYTDTVDHTYTEAVAAPTCVAEGYTTHTCTVCSDSYTDSYTDTIEHNYKTQVILPTCSREGYTRNFCVAGCKDEYKNNYTDTIPHTYKTVVTEPTCTAQGYTTYTCSVCKYTCKDDYTDKKPHNYVIETIAPTCTYSGYDYYKCQDCIDYYYTAYVDKLPHSYEETVVDPTCTNGGYSYLDCSVCGDSKWGTLTEKLGHTYTDLHCIRCNKKEYSYDLDYTLSSDGTYYTVSGIGDCQDTELIIPNTHRGIPVKKIAASAFEGNTQIKWLIFLSGEVEQSIGERAFFGCSSLISITCDSVLAEVSIGAFADCAALERITLDKKNTAYYTEGNCLIDTETGFLIAGCKNSVIPNDGSVLGIEEYAFYGCTGLAEITVPESVIFIFKYAFKGCTSLKAAHFTYYPYWYMMKSREGVFDREPTLGGTDNFSSSDPEYNAKQLLWYTEWNYYKAIVKETE